MYTRELLHKNNWGERSVRLNRKNEVSAHGTFINKGGFTYRSEASIEWGDGESILGVLVMMNPGEAAPETKESIGLVKDGYVDRSPLKIDTTMRKIISIFEQSVFAEQPINGKLIIYNLFNLQKANSKEAVQTLRRLKLDDPVLNSLSKDHDQIRKTLSMSPWVWIGWGCKNDLSLRKLQKQWLHLIDEIGVYKFGIQGNHQLDFYHPHQWIPDRQQIYTIEILKQFELFHKKKAIVKVISTTTKKLNDKELIIDEVLKKRKDRLSEKIRESNDYYEYMILPNYEELDAIQEIHGVALDQINVVVVENIVGFNLVSIEFPKRLFTLEQTTDWLLRKNIYFSDETKRNHPISGVEKITDAVLFFGHVIAEYTKGQDVLNIDTSELSEITELYTKQNKKVNTKHLKKLANRFTVNIDGKEVIEFSSLQFDRKRDMIISNGMIIYADYIDLYKNGLGFFVYTQDKPIAQIVDEQTQVDIRTYLDANANQICVIEYSYNLNIDVVE